MTNPNKSRPLERIGNYIAAHPVKAALIGAAGLAIMTGLVGCATAVATPDVAGQVQGTLTAIAHTAQAALTQTPTAVQHVVETVVRTPIPSLTPTMTPIPPFTVAADSVQQFCANPGVANLLNPANPGANPDALVALYKNSTELAANNQFGYDSLQRICTSATSQFLSQIQSGFQAIVTAASSYSRISP